MASTSPDSLCNALYTEPYELQREGAMGTGEGTGAMGTGEGTGAMGTGEETGACRRSHRNWGGNRGHRNRGGNEVMGTGEETYFDPFLVTEI